MVDPVRRMSLFIEVELSKQILLKSHYNGFSAPDEQDRDTDFMELDKEIFLTGKKPGELEAANEHKLS